MYKWSSQSKPFRTLTLVTFPPIVFSSEFALRPIEPLSIESDVYFLVVETNQASDRDGFRGGCFVPPDQVVVGFGRGLDVIVASRDMSVMD